MRSQTEGQPADQAPSASRPDEGNNGLRWLLLSGVWLVYFSFGIIATSMAPLIPVIASELNIDNARMGLILGAWPLVYLVAALPSGILLDFMRPRASLLIAGLFIGASGLARALAADEVTMFLAVALLGIGGPLISVGAPKLIAQVFEGPSRGLAMGIYLTGPALGSAVSLALTNSVMMPMVGQNWRLVLGIYGLLGVISGIYWFVIAGRSLVTSNSTAVGERQGFSFGGLRSILSMPVVQLVLVMAIGIFFINHALNNWLPEILRANGLSASTAGYVASVPTMVGVAGSLIIPRLAIPTRRLFILITLFGVTFVSALLLHSSDVPILLFALLLMGIARGATIPIATLLLIEAHGIENSRHGLVVGLFFAAGEIGGVLGPVTVGILSSRSGDFTSSIYSMALVAATMIALTAIMLQSERRTSA